MKWFSMAVKKVVDSWKAKKWYTVVSPKFLNEVEVGEIPATDEKHIVNRIIKIPLKDITKDLSHVYTTIKLRITEIKGKTAYTKFIGHEVSREYIHALVRRRTDALNAVFTVTSRDGIEFKVKAVVLTGTSCSESQKNAVRVKLASVLKAMAHKSDFGMFIYATLFGRTSGEVYRSLKKIAPIKRIEIRKTELKEVFDTDEKLGDDLDKEEAEGEAAEAEGHEAAAEAPARTEEEGSAAESVA